MDQIRIEQLEVFAKHGAIPEENVLGQKFLVSAVLFTDTRKAGRNDQLDQTISYGRASKFMERYLREHTFQLIESAAEKTGGGTAAHVSRQPEIRGIRDKKALGPP